LGTLLLQLRHGSPKNKRYLRLLQEEGLASLVGQVENANIRDEKGIKAVASGLLKLLFPDGKFTPEELCACVAHAISYRQRVINQRYILYRDPVDQKTLGLKMRA